MPHDELHIKMSNISCENDSQRLQRLFEREVKGVKIRVRAERNLSFRYAVE